MSHISHYKNNDSFPTTRGLHDVNFICQPLVSDLESNISVHSAKTIFDNLYYQSYRAITCSLNLKRIPPIVNYTRYQ